MANCLLIRFRDFTDFHQLSLFCPFLKVSQDGSFFLYAHVAMIAAVMIAGNRLNTVIPVFCYKSCHSASMESCCRRYLIR